MNHFNCLEDAKKDFKKKFWEKTKNKWEDRKHFVPHPNKYTLIELQGEAESQEAVVKVKGQEGAVGSSKGQRWGTACQPIRGQRGSPSFPLWPWFRPFLMSYPAPCVGILPNGSCPSRPSLPRWMVAQ